MLGEEFGVTAAAAVAGSSTRSTAPGTTRAASGLGDPDRARGGRRRSGSGSSSAPALGRRWWAERGAGAFANGDPIRVSGVGQVKDAVLSLALERPLPAVAHRCAPARLRGLLGPHARRGGPSKRNHPDRGQGLGSRCAAADRRGGRRPLQRSGRHRARGRPLRDLVERAPARGRCSSGRRPYLVASLRRRA